MIRSKQRKGQAALDYMFTYGWAFLGILIALGVLTYFGVFDVNRFRVQECIFPPGAFCDDFTITDGINLNIAFDGAAHFDLVNAFGADLTVTDISATSLDMSNVPITCSFTSNPTASPVALSAFPTNWDSETTVHVICPIVSSDFTSGQSYDVTITVNFEQQSVAGYSYTLVGVMQARATS